MGPLEHPSLWRVVGMFLLVYAPAFWWVARNPERHPHLVLIATAGKVLGPWVSVSPGLRASSPVEVGLLLIGNDFIWLPAFFLYLRTVAHTRGWRTFLAGG